MKNAKESIKKRKSFTRRRNGLVKQVLSFFVIVLTKEAKKAIKIGGANAVLDSTRKVLRKFRQTALRHPAKSNSVFSKPRIKNGESIRYKMNGEPYFKHGARII